MRCTRTLLGAACATVLAAALGACGDDSKLPQAQTTPFSAGTVSIIQQGNANATIDPGSVNFSLDNAHGLVVHLTLRSGATSATTLVVRGSIYDPAHHLVGDVTGGQVAVAAGQTAQVTLNGPTPLGTIASATFEVTAMTVPS